MSDATELTAEALLEAVIFASPQPVAVEALSNIAGLTIEETESTLAALGATLATRGLRLQRNRNRVQLVSAPEAAPHIEELLGLDVQLRFTQAAMETLSIVAYAQPVTRPQVESIRGVSSDSTLRTLLAAGMIEERGRTDSLGRPILYGTTFEFLQQFGLQRLDELPPLEPKAPREAAESAPTATEDPASSD